MSERIDCPNCGERIERPAGFTRKKIRCPACGYYAETPAAWQTEDAPTASTPTLPGRAGRAKRPEPVARRRLDPRDHRPDFSSDTPSGEPLLAGDDDDESDAPYAVPGSGLFPCPECREQLPLGATLCVHCGYDIDKRKKRKRPQRAIHASFVEGPTLTTRLQVFGGLQVFNVIFTGLLWVQSGSQTGQTDLITFLSGLAINSALQAFLIGSFSTLVVERGNKGRASLYRQSRIAFLPMGDAELEWSGATSVGVLATYTAGMFTYLMCLYLLMMGCVPGIAFWYFVIRPERHNVVIVDVYGSEVETLYRGLSHEPTETCAQFVADATGLLLHPVNQDCRPAQLAHT